MGRTAAHETEKTSGQLWRPAKRNPGAGGRPEHPPGPQRRGEIHLVGLPAGHALRYPKRPQQAGLHRRKNPLPALERRGDGGRFGAHLAGEEHHPAPGAQTEQPLWKFRGGLHRHRGTRPRPHRGELRRGPHRRTPGGI